MMTAAQLRTHSARRFTAPDFQACKLQRRKVVMVTAYDATFARLLDSSGVDALLVGDSLGMVIQGRDNTLSVTLDEIIYHTAAVARGTSRAHLVGDLPFMSYQCSVEDAIRSAGRLMKDGGAHSVKLEGGEAFAEHVSRIVAAGIPVMGHIGLTPQSVHALGGFKMQGKTADAAARLRSDALALQQAGAYAVVVEAVPAAVGEDITRSLTIPTIGIGAGPACDGQVLVLYDLLGMNDTSSPRFVKHYERLNERIRSACNTFVEEVHGESFPALEHCYRVAPITTHEVTCAAPDHS